jgi:hypothetical protein
MPKKLTILGALTAALVFGYFGLFNGSATGAPIQQFDTSGVFEVDVNWCYGGAFPVPDGSGGVNCGAGSSSTTVPKDTALNSWSLIRQPIGNRLGLPITFTPSDGTTEWQTVAPACAAGSNNECNYAYDAGWNPTAGSITGEVTARSDILCTNGADDVLGKPGGTTGNPATQWPDLTRWPAPSYVRTSASGFNGGFGLPTAGSANAYVWGITPFPKNPPNAFTFGSIDTSVLTQLYLTGIAPFALPDPVRLQLASGVSSYASQSSDPANGLGLGVSVALLGGSPDNPPTDSFTCLDSPQDSVSTTTYLKTPNADRVIPRWVYIASAADIDDGTQQVLLDWQCVTVGAGEPDADGDCDPDATDSNDGVKDIDGDLLPDGVERFLGSSPTVADTDADGSGDFEEMVNFTDPTVADSDGDGQADKRDLIPTNGTETADATDATDDNCPADANGAADGDPSRPGVQASQLNTDSLYQYHGHTLNADGSTASLFADKSNPDEDFDGDACDEDDDNDEMPDATELVFTIVPWSGTSDPGGADLPDSAVCAAPGVGVAPLAPVPGTSWAVNGPWDGDMDADLVLDGRECQFRSRPDMALKATASCVAAPADPDGCAQPKNGGAGGATDDPDGDLLFLNGGGGASHVAVEATMRTTGINVCRVGAGEPPCPAGGSATGQDNDTDNDTLIGSGDKDSDRDFCESLVGCTRPAAPNNTAAAQDGLEVIFYGTGPATFDTDRDGCPDAEEIADITGDFKVNSSDQLQFVTAKNAVPALGKLDTDNDGDVDNYHLANKDLNKDKSLNAPDQLMMAQIIAAAGACSATEGAIAIGKLAKNLP